MPSNLFISTMRFIVPLVAGWLLTLAVDAGVTLDSDKLVTAVTAVLALAYYLLFRLLEVLGTKLRGTKLQTVAGLFLGWARPPQYPSVDDALPPLTGYSSTSSHDV